MKKWALAMVFFLVLICAWGVMSSSGVSITLIWVGSRWDSRGTRRRLGFGCHYRRSILYGHFAGFHPCRCRARGTGRFGFGGTHSYGSSVSLSPATVDPAVHCLGVLRRGTLG